MMSEVNIQEVYSNFFTNTSNFGVNKSNLNTSDFQSFFESYQSGTAKVNQEKNTETNLITNKSNNNLLNSKANIQRDNQATKNQKNTITKDNVTNSEEKSFSSGTDIKNSESGTISDSKKVDQESCQQKTEKEVKELQENNFKNEVIENENTSDNLSSDSQDEETSTENILVEVLQNKELILEDISTEITLDENLDLDKISKFNKIIQDLKSKIDEKGAVAILVYNPDLITEISEVLQISIDELVNILSENKMTISDLSQTENLISFMQDVLEVDTPEALISIDNIKEVMTQISKIAEKVSYEEIVQVDYKNVEQVAQELQESFTIITDTSKEIDEVSSLLQKIDGEVIETVEDTYNNLQQSSYTGAESNKQMFENFNSSTNFSEQGTAEIEILDNENLTLFSQQVSLQGNSTNLTNVSQKVGYQRNVNSLDVINQIMDKIKTSVKTDVSEIKLLLRPDSLGEVSLKISTQNGLLVAQFTAESQKVKEIIESNFNQLKDMLNEKGIEVSQLDVNVNDQDSNQNSKSFEQFAFEQEKSEARVQKIINKVFQETQEVTEYIEGDELISSNVNYSI